MIDPQQLQDAKQALGRRLRELRKGHGLVQKEVAQLVYSTRSTVANVEAGRQVVDRVFWQQCDTVLKANNGLLDAYDAYRRLQGQYQKERSETALRARWGAAADGALDQRASSDLQSVHPQFNPAEPVGGDLASMIASALGETDRESRADHTIPAPGGHHFPGASVEVEVYPATDDGRIVAMIPRTDTDRRWRRPLQRRIVAGRVTTSTGDGLFGLDSRQASQRLVDIDDEVRLLIPRAYELDAITAAVLWAVANLDQSLLLDDARLDASRTAAAEYSGLVRSAVSSDIGQDLEIVSRMWLGSAFCADHISRQWDGLTEVPTFWTREQTGEEASTWLLFGHKLRYLEATATRFATGSQRATRMFCVPRSAVEASTESQRVLLLLAVALMESFGIDVAITNESEYGALPGLVLTSQRAIVATWIRADGVWHVDVTCQRSALAEYRDAAGYVRAHSVVAADTAGSRLRALADYLGLDWPRLRGRCAELGACGLAGIAEPRSRLLSLDGVDRACRFVGALP
ncbi:helix-turn-helix transcriptional regulator [Micromonospora sp. WMMD1082]|uniref:helix-turn-helix transcriptional regulator n=1 Tax=Micromonospora sp. WMMD1082 TaxID=3016104 RepID=UPI0024162C22|nr:helix-turn-helix transcriptional regulator [Micromonospora sp. WMMD1082]MDG4793019.1 helix-turn-helix transcriptional regulator [Micromonospora sp. WMMD1082]